VSALGQEGTQPRRGFGNGVRCGDASGIEARFAAIFDQPGFGSGGIGDQKSRSA
jgi:hypothetical protein